MQQQTLLPTKLDRQFQMYHMVNPQVFLLLVNYTRRLKDRGFQHYGIKAVFERIRWEINVETNDPAGFKMNNNYTSRYARLLEKTYPEFTGFYHKRGLKS